MLRPHLEIGMCERGFERNTVGVTPCTVPCVRGVGKFFASVPCVAVDQVQASFCKL
jgi:hypothetical protein